MWLEQLAALPPTPDHPLWCLELRGSDPLVGGGTGPRPRPTDRPQLDPPTESAEKKESAKPKRKTAKRTKPATSFRGIEGETGRRRSSGSSVRRLLSIELAGHAEQPPVRGRGGDDHRLELRRVGGRRQRAPPAAGSRESRSPPSSCPGWRRSVASPFMFAPSPAADSTPGPARIGGSGWARSRSGSRTRRSSSPGSRACPSASSASTTATPRLYDYYHERNERRADRRSSSTPGSRWSDPSCMNAISTFRAR